ncbi:mRNA splicing protein prp18 [Serendipita sp. 411]|nr:mRNA splicing protein prp18 [Serendipita sp. 411]
MEALKAELAKKRKAAEDEANSRPTKYMRKGDIERMKREEEAAQKLVQRAKSEEQNQKSGKATPEPTKSTLNTPEASGTPEPTSQFNISNEEAIRRLRAKGQPIRLFGESDKDRRLRLRALELIEERVGDKTTGQNDFRKALEDVEEEERRKMERGTQNDTKKGEKREADTQVDLALIKADPDKLYPVIYYALKKTLADWAQWMDERPESVKRTNQGKIAAATQVQSGEYLKPLFKQLRARSLAPDVLARIAEIVHYMQKRQYQRANDAYLRLSIGNAPWPIGVTMVGIHERSAREKISTDLVAHVLNDEVSRKYIQSLKRLLTFSQTKYPPEDSSQLMG